MNTLHHFSRYLAILATGLAIASGAAHAAVEPLPMSNTSIKLKAINLSGAEYSSSQISALVNVKYTYPNNAEIDYYKSKGFTAIRLPFSGPRLQPVNNGELNGAELARIRAVVDYAASKQMYVILDPHDYGSKYDSTSKSMKLIGTKTGLPTSQLGNFWKRLALAFRSDPNVIFGIMNEPHSQTAAEWKAAADYAIYGIRKAGAKQLILIPGTNWTAAWAWEKSGNAAQWAGYTSGGQIAFEVHQYLDSDSSGTHSSCSTGKTARALDNISAWARANKVKLFLGETGWAQNATCLAEGEAMTKYIGANRDVWMGLAYWSGGKWVSQSYMFMLTPSNLAAPVDKPQMKAIVENF
ncbi:MAG TPA: glycoside hydrolase family 5 protein [Oxalicibacterium sp.]|nr:glycoside hydrolase family 5 protein [Oxalicibacterium sp.]